MKKQVTGGNHQVRAKRKLRRHRKYRGKGFKSYRGQGR